MVSATKTLLLVAASAGLLVAAQGPPAYLLRLINTCDPNGPLTIHGLWPEGKEWCPGPPFNSTALATLSADLQRWWPSCEGDDNATAFHEHEWLKHGRCAPWVIYDYFALALGLRAKYPDAEQTCFNTNLVTTPCHWVINVSPKDKWSLPGVFVCSPTACRAPALIDVCNTAPPPI